MKVLEKSRTTDYMDAALTTKKTRTTTTYKIDGLDSPASHQAQGASPADTIETITYLNNSSTHNEASGEDWDGDDVTGESGVSAQDIASVEKHSYGYAKIRQRSR